MSSSGGVEERIAKIEKARLHYEDHGILTCGVTLGYGGGASQGAGNYCLDRYNKATGEREGTAFGLEWIMRLMAVAGVDDFSKIEGRTVIAWIEGGLVRGLKPLPTEGGRPFVFEDLAIKYWGAGRVKLIERVGDEAEIEQVHAAVGEAQEAWGHVVEGQGREATARAFLRDVLSAHVDVVKGDVLHAYDDEGFSDRTMSRQDCETALELLREAAGRVEQLLVKFGQPPVSP